MHDGCAGSRARRAARTSGGTISTNHHRQIAEAVQRRNMTHPQVQTSAGSSQLDLGGYQRDSTARAASAIASLTYAYGGLTGTVRLLSADVEDGRREVRSIDLDLRISAKAASGAELLLEELSTGRGLGWSEIAQLCEVSVSAVRKWRAGEAISPERRRALARLAAFLDLLEEVGPVNEPVGWLNMRMSDQLTVTAADLYIDGRADDLLEHAQGHLGLDALLDRWNPNWRTAVRSEWKIVNRPDGERVLTRR